MSNPFDSNEVRSYTTGRTAEDEINQYEREIEKILQESVDSTQRSVQRLEHSEQLGTNTANELLSQREKLERTEKNLDEIHRTTYETQRNLNSLKSFFGGFFKNKFSRGPKEPSADIPASKSDNKLNSHLNASSSSSARSTSITGGPSLSADSRKAIQGTRFEAMDSQIDENLGQMSSQLGRLRDLGKALGDEVEDQNQMISRIQTKASRNDDIVRHQDDQMRKLM
jgi:synaptosomal-associated protein 29|uniref:t-SNARE coiled-coil homology domain-containing protein n=1 Tax=Panagrolaimus sp. PS1159 TaxID=55785 RepID=A0AC35G6L0_9BILA